MTKEQAKEMLQAKLECLENTTSPKPCDCECIECDLEYRQGNMGEQKQALDMAIKALEQQTINCNATTEEIAQSFKTDIEAVKDYLPKCNSMEYPKTFDEFANDYGFTDDKEIYTNGSHLIPVFRVKQWLDHIEQQPTSEDCVSRQAILDGVKSMSNANPSYWITCDVVDREDLIDGIQSLPPVTHTQRWIPVSERLPEVGEKVLCQCQANIYDVLKLTVDGWYYDKNHCYMSGFVIAWQPLPKPYEEKRGNENGSN